MATSTSTSDAASAPSVTDVDTVLHVELYATNSEDVLVTPSWQVCKMVIR